MDVSDRHPLLPRSPGLTEWVATLDRTGKHTFKTFEECLASPFVDEDVKKKVLGSSHTQSQSQSQGEGGTSFRGLWPPENAPSLGLEKCMRVYPHVADTGGFFVAVLQRRSRREMEAMVREKKEEEKRERGVKRERKEGDAEGEEVVKKVKLDLEGEAEGEGEGEGDEDAEGDVDLELEQEQEREKEQEAAAAQTVRLHDPGFRENPYTFLPSSHPIVQSCLSVPSFSFSSLVALC